MLSLPRKKVMKKYKFPESGGCLSEASCGAFRKLIFLHYGGMPPNKHPNLLRTEPMELKIAEIFNSIEGEGKRVGVPTSFIRLAGCNLRCIYCDTQYAQDHNQGQIITADEIMANLHYKRVTITGGEPLLAKNIDKLIQQLLKEGIEVNIETNGSIDIRSYSHRNSNLFFTIDYKLPSSGAHHQMLFENYLSLKPWDVIKFVVGSSGDMTETANFIQRIQPSYTEMPQIFIGAVHECFDLRILAENILKTPILKDARLQLQLHKIIWDATMRGV